MDPALASQIAPSVPIVFQDALGERRRLDANGVDPVEVLCLRGELTAVPSFEFALRERASRLAAFRHTYFGRVRGVDRLNDPGATLAVVSDHTRGLRLSTLLAESGPRPIRIDVTVALHFIRQLVSAVAMLHESARDVAHGAIAPERIVVTPSARIVVVEYVLGAALEQLRFSRDRYWRELRIPLPSSPGLPRFDHRADVTQIGVVALSLVLGRMLRDDEYIANLPDVLASAWAISPKGGLEPLPSALRGWLSRALQLDPRQSFASAVEAKAELEKIVAAEPQAESTSATLIPAERIVNSDSEATVAPSPRPAETSIDAAPPPATVPSQTAPEKADAKPEPSGWRQVRKTDEDDDESTSPSAEPELEDADAQPETLAFGAATALASRGPGRVAVAAMLGLVLVAAGVYGARRMFAAPAAQVATGTLSISTNPAGAEVRVDGEARGMSPLSVAVKPGAHNIELRGAGDPRTVSVTVAAGAQVTQYIELPVFAPIATAGQLQIRTEPADAQVSVDGVARGRSPVLVDGLTPGDHIVTLQSDLGVVKQTVTVTAATTASLVVPLSAADGAPVSGWLSVAAPVDVQILENKRLLGTSQSDRIMVSAGRHEIEIVNEVLGYRSVKVVQVPAGKVTPIKVEWPKGTVAVNAVPWAEVWIDGDRIGETPIGNLSLPIGPHEIVFRHPELDELHHAVTVTLNTPARVSVDLRKKP